MAIVVKKIGKKEYAYHAYRVGKRVIQKYIGPASGQVVSVKRTRLEEGKEIPLRFQSLFWDADPRTISVKQHAGYIIERVLEMGDLDAVLWLQRAYPTSLIIESIESSRKISPRSRNFWEIWFGVRHAY